MKCYCPALLIVQVAIKFDGNAIDLVQNAHSGAPSVRSDVKKLSMNTPAKLLLSALMIFSTSCHMHANTEKADSSFQVVLKLDDMSQSQGGIPSQWQRVYDYATERGTPISVGIICNSLEGDNAGYFDALKAWNASGLVEFWHHGYDHKQWTVDGKRMREFAGSGYDHQFKHFKDSQDLASEKLSIDFTTFGAPFNATDEDTKRVLQQYPGITVWLYGPKGDAAGKTVLKRNYSVNLEVKVGDVDFDVFQAAYLAKPVGQLLVLQGHPRGWDDQDFSAFTRVVDFLSEQGATFVLPRDCVSQ